MDYQNPSLQAKLLLKVFLSLKCVWLIVVRLLVLLINVHPNNTVPRLYYLNVRNFHPLEIGVQSSVFHFIPICHYVYDVPN